MSCSDQPYYLWAFPWQAFNGDGWFNPQALLIGFSSRWLVTQTHTHPLTPSPPGISDPPTASSLKKASKHCSNTASSFPLSWMYPYLLWWGRTVVSLLALPLCFESVESGCMQQRMQKPMQIKPRQTLRHLGDDRRRPDEKAMAPILWLSHDSNVITSHEVCRVFWCTFQCLLNLISGNWKL